MKSQRGYSLIEMMTVLAVVSTLAFMAAGSYVSYSTKVQVAEAMKVVEGMQAAYRADYVDNGRVPPTTLVELMGSTAIPKDNMGRFVGSVDVDGGALVVTYGLAASDALTGKVLTMTPHETGGGGLIWQCGLAPVPVDIDGLALPVAGTRAGVPIAGTLAATTVDAEYLPRECRT